MELTVKTLFIVFVVILVFIILFITLQSNVSSEQEQLKFSGYANENDFLMSILSDPELTYGSYLNKGNLPKQAVLDAVKLSSLDKTNKELSSIHNYGFLYSLIVRDDETGKSWIIGLNNPPDFARMTLAPAYHVAITYHQDVPTVHLGVAMLRLYVGPIPTFIGKIKSVCSTKTSAYARFSLEHDLEYNSQLGEMKIDNFTFYPYFSCPVKSFKISKNTEQIVKIKYDGSGVTIVS